MWSSLFLKVVAIDTGIRWQQPPSNDCTVDTDQHHMIIILIKFLVALIQSSTWLKSLFKSEDKMTLASKSHELIDGSQLHIFLRHQYIAMVEFYIDLSLHSYLLAACMCMKY